MIKASDVDKLVKNLNSTGLFVECKAISDTPIKAIHSFKLKGTNFYLDIVPASTQMGISYLHWNGSIIGNFKICWEKKGLIWESFEFFDMLQEVPEEIAEKLLFHLDLLSVDSSKRYSFNK